MEFDEFEKTLKVIVVGNGQVGKTSMTTRYAKGRYTGQYKKTIGVDFMEKTIYLPDVDEEVNLMIWDTAGQEEFDKLTSRYYKGAGAVVYVFSTVDRDSFDALLSWKRKVEEECGDIAQVLVQNKVDLIDDAQMTRCEVEDMADRMNIKLYRSCVQDNLNVEQVFEYITRKFLRYGDNDVQALTSIDSLTTPNEEEAIFNKSSKNTDTTYEKRDGEIKFDAKPKSDPGCTATVHNRNVDEIELEMEEPKASPTAPSKQRTGGKKRRVPQVGECIIN